MSSYEITREWLSDWLARIGRDRDWLAEQVGVSRRTIDNWYSRKQTIPLTVQILVRRIATEIENAQVKFSAEEFTQIEDARKLTLHETAHEFIMDAAKKLAAEVVHQHERKTGDGGDAKGQ